MSGALKMNIFTRVVIVLFVGMVLMVIVQGCLEEMAKDIEEQGKKNAGAPAPVKKDDPKVVVKDEAKPLIRRLNEAFEKENQKKAAVNVAEDEKRHQRNLRIIGLQTDIQRLQVKLESEIRDMRRGADDELRPLYTNLRQLESEVESMRFNLKVPFPRKKSKFTQGQVDNKEEELNSIRAMIAKIKTDLESEVESKRLDSKKEQDVLNEEIRKLNPFPSPF